MRTLTLALKAIYFDDIKAGRKLFEYRLDTPYWRKRLEGQIYDQVVLTKGYPRRDDASRRLTLPWRGCHLESLTHEHFGPDPVVVFAINVKH